ncbi:glycoside hydrolase family 3 N-terminal domain-containing protein [Salinibacter sp. 10B]|uniref:glycoside hydrolase family 3 N-terminal domain-containing protein n=1 Tax=Salinibacter sp. 10B TaxID=1923971 RepID=UPI000CF3D191|nr:glycoside hydrolase family 3 N-terminal domain-containing protein [Salinibacter sp. 10B]
MSFQHVRSSLSFLRASLGRSRQHALFSASLLVQCAALLLTALTFGCSSSESATAPSVPSDTVATTDTTDTSLDWSERQFRDMTLDEKIAQLFIIRLDGYFQNADAPSYRRSVALVEEFGAGGMMFGPGTPMTQITMINDLQRKAERPLLVSQDTEWGVGMRLDEATVFPPAMALGATRDASLAYRVGHVTAREARALGVHQIYAPVADINNNPRNPIINIRSFGENPTLVGTMAGAFAEGAQAGGTLATVKHFPGHGDTDVDSHMALPVLRFDRARLDTLELAPFRQVMDAGVASVMTGHLALPKLTKEETTPASLSPNVTTDLLRTEMGFEDLVVTDALNMDAVRQKYGVGETAVRVLESGADLILMSTNPWVAHHAIRTAVDTGRIDTSEINDSVRRLLNAKEKMGLHEQRIVPLDTTRQRVDKRTHQVLSETVARRSLTLLSNQNDLLPLTPPDTYKTLVVKLSDSEYPGVGDTFVQSLDGHPAIDSLGVRRLDPRSDSSDVNEYLTDAQDYDVVIVPSFLRVRAWSGSIGFNDMHQTFLDSLVANGPPTVLTAFGNPYAPSGLDPQPDAVLAAYGSNDVSQRAAAQALTGAAGTPGRLPVTIPDLADAGHGLTLETVSPRAGHPESVGMDGQQLADVDSLLRQAMLDGAFPGAAVAVGRGEVLPKLDGHGYYTYDQKKRVQTSSQYDLASLTKVVATTTATMLLVERDSISLDAPVARYLPSFAQNGKDAVTVRQLLSHSSGLKPYLGPDERGPSRTAVLDTVMAQPLAYTPGTESRYSGLNMLTLLHIVETVTGQRFDRFCKENIFDPLGMEDTGFYSLERTASWVVPTTDTTGTEYRGSVHDPMARSMGGVSGNAGLFSTAEDLARFAYMLTHEGRIDGRQFLEAETIETFTSKADVPGSTRALGWDTKSSEGYSSAGDRFSDSSFGHTGYTGTSMWMDPTQDLFVILLTNRVYPDDTDEQIQQVRPKVANEVYESIVGPPQPLLPGSPPKQ